MNANGLINMVVRQFLGRFMNKGIDAGIDYAAKRGKRGEELSHEERLRARNAKQTAKRAQQAGRLIRRIGRF
ncbi:hypothetical protein [Actibacterium lipolyticum]|uniref:Uncharacterized protein n=1 Tax=Actibacterium lipolyticum TaxID=1524263 RepID=A0A238KG20_9RHOB|nr:hypothetical protein [Actibacterium lipolyticum]SMX41773.1 hypothetical protein COL8621_01824 [Actibacterium lipolyticum]